MSLRCESPDTGRSYWRKMRWPVVRAKPREIMGYCWIQVGGRKTRVSMDTNYCKGLRDSSGHLGEEHGEVAVTASSEQSLDRGSDSESDVAIRDRGGRQG